MAQDFVKVFPPELSNVLFSYLSDHDLLSASRCCVLWRNIVNNDQQWANRCLKLGWTTTQTLNEPHHWKRRSHIDSKTQRGRLKPTPELKKLEHDDSRLDPLCDWAIYYRQRLHTLRNWRKGSYVMHELIPPEVDAGPLIISESSYNGRYLAIGTISGYAFVWDVTGIPNMLQQIKPVQPNKEVTKVEVTSEGHLVVVYEGAFIHVYEEKVSSSENVSFQLKALGKIFLQISDPQRATLQAEIWSKTDITLLASDEQLDTRKYLTLFAARTENEIPLVEDLLLSLNGETLLISCEGESSYILWNLKDDQDYQIQGLPSPSCRITQILIDGDLLVFAIEQEHPPSESCFAILVYKTTETVNDSLKITPLIEAPVPSLVDELVCDRNNRIETRLVFCSHDGLVGAYCIRSKGFMFLNHTGTTVNNVTSCKQLILYHESIDYNIAALSWTGTLLYKITGHIGPIRQIRIIDQFIVSGGAARELMIWDKDSGHPVNRIYHQPNRIANLYTSSTCILTVGKDDSPVLIGFL